MMSHLAMLYLLLSNQDLANKASLPKKKPYVLVHIDAVTYK